MGYMGPKLTDSDGDTFEVYQDPFDNKYYVECDSGGPVISGGFSLDALTDYLVSELGAEAFELAIARHNDAQTKRVDPLSRAIGNAVHDKEGAITFADADEMARFLVNNNIDKINGGSNE